MPRWESGAYLASEEMEAEWTSDLADLNHCLVFPMRLLVTVVLTSLVSHPCLTSHREYLVPG